MAPLVRAIWASAISYAAAFDIEAHDAIGQTSASAMDQPAIKQVKRLLDGKDASDVAGWGHQVDDTFPGMERLHFQVHDDQAAPWCEVDKRVAKCEDNICLISAIKHFYGKVLADEGRKMDYPQIDYTKAHKGITFTDADAVKMLINLIGDLHQPMHVGYAGDDMGRSIQIKFKGQQMSLYDFWDRGISETIQKEEENFWLGGWTHVGRVRSEFDNDSKKWKEEGAFKSIDRWADESVKFACETAYVHPQTKKKLGGPAWSSEVIDFDDRAYASYKADWLKRILIAGERTAIVLNDILDAAGAAKLGDGTKVKTDADKKEEETKLEWAEAREERNRIEKAMGGGSGGPLINMYALRMNFMVACFVVPAFLAVVEFGVNPATYLAMFSGDSGGRPGAKRFE